MAAFHVYVEGPVERSPEAIERLAAAISAKYGLPAPDLVTRMTKGRFRVKANIDRATADAYAQALQQVGAVVTIEEATPTTPVPVVTAVAPRPATPSLQPAGPVAPRPVTPAMGTPSAGAARTSASSLPPSTAARPAVSALPPPAAAKAAPLQSGLSAAYSGEMPATNLGALEGLSLASLDGNDGGQPAPPPAAFEPATDVPAPSEMALAKPTRPTPKPAPLDLFAPPDEGEELRVDLAVDDSQDRARKSAPMAAAVPASPPTSPPLSPPLRRTPHSIQAPSPPVLGTSAVDSLPRGRFALGVFVAICLGFVPAHLFASWREQATFRDIDAQIVSTQQSATTPEKAAALDSFREAQIGRKKSERRNIAMISMLLWAVAGAGLGFVWSRKLPWDRGAS